MLFFFSSRRRHTRLRTVTGVQTCALPIALNCELIISRLMTLPTDEAKAISANLRAQLETYLTIILPSRPDLERHLQTLGHYSGVLVASPPCYLSDDDCSRLIYEGPSSISDQTLRSILLDGEALKGVHRYLVLFGPTLWEKAFDAADKCVAQEFEWNMPSSIIAELTSIKVSEDRR